MQTNEINAWLGPAAAELSGTQLERFQRVWEDITTRFNGPDDTGLRDGILAGALQYLLGETDLDKAGQRLEAARTEETEALAAVLNLAAMAIDDGMSESEAARRARVDRKTLRKALGK